MATARLDYVAPWWTYWLHNFPHFNFSLLSVDSTFKPEDGSYQQVGNDSRQQVSWLKGAFISFSRDAQENVTEQTARFNPLNEVKGRVI